MLPGRLPQIQINQNIILALNCHLLPIIELSLSIRFLLGHVFPSKIHLASFNINALEYSGRSPERAPQLQSTGMLPGTSTQICYSASIALNSDWVISTEIFRVYYCRCGKFLVNALIGLISVSALVV